jgi:CBS domain containing-hemolysin-like protein
MNANSNSYSLLVNLIIFTISLTLCALMAFLETCITALRLYKVKQLAEETDRYQSLLYSLEKNHSRVLTTILIAKNLADVTSATFGADIMARLLFFLPETMAIWVGIFIVTTFILIFGEIIPKLTANVYGERFFESTLGITNVIYYMLYPIVQYCVPLIHRLIGRVFGMTPQESQQEISSEKELRFLIDYITEKGIMEREKTGMLKGIFELSKTSVRDIMVPAANVIALDVNATVQEALELFNRHQFSRIPVYIDVRENIIGMLHMKDLFFICSQYQHTTLRDIMRPVLFVPEGTKVNQLLKEFKLQHMHLALVINEYGMIIGLVTLEDVLEEIVGEIHDEYEVDTSKVTTLNPESWLIDASIELKALTELLNVKFETEHAQTLNGFLNEQMQRIPRKGERLLYKNFCFQVQQASVKRTLQVLVFKKNADIRPLAQ